MILGTCVGGHGLGVQKPFRVREAKLLTVQSTFDGSSQAAPKGFSLLPSRVTRAELLWAVAAEERALTEEVVRCSIVLWWPCSSIVLWWPCSSL
jgi:hypothetical protein